MAFQIDADKLDAYVLHVLEKYKAGDLDAGTISADFKELLNAAAVGDPDFENFLEVGAE